MNIAVVASEAVPLAKTGGLADVAGALPLALERLGHRATLIVPAYRVAFRSGLPLESTGWSVRFMMGDISVDANVLRTQLPDSQVAVYLVDHPASFDRDGLYQTDDGEDYPDNARRFILFCRAAVEILSRLDPPPDVVHTNDWQTGLIPVYLKQRGFGPPALLTIHNLGYQGIFDASAMGLTGLEHRLFNWRELEFHGKLNLLKAGLVFSDMISTVSPTYAREIQTPEYGRGLDGLLRSRNDVLRGIVNGVDVEAWSPARERMIIQNYDADCHDAGKAACKAALQRRASLPERLDVPLVAQIGRLDPQKGWDLLAETADEFLEGDVQMVVLGTGLPRYENRLLHLMDRHPGKIRAFLEFDEPLAHQIEAGADIFLMPSLYEPCGLNQMYSLIHGTIPVVRKTGGLADTVVDANPSTLEAGMATGFLFDEPTRYAFRAALDRALALWHDRETWNQLIRNGMKTDWSWERRARDYAALYEEVRRHATTRATPEDKSPRMTSLAEAI